MATSETQVATVQDQTMECGPMAEPQKEHQWLQRLVGEWTSEAEMVMGPDKPAQTSKGTETVRSLGSIWTVAEGQGEMPDGTTGTMILTLGYDPQKKRFVGTWVGSMMTHLWVYDGWLDESGKVLTLESDGPKMGPEGPAEGTAKYRDVIELKSDDYRTLTSRMLGDDGEWHHFMTAHYHRRK